MLTPIIFIIFQLQHGVHPITFKLVMAAKYPWSISSPSFLYFCHYTMEVIALSNAIIVTCGLDTYFMLCILQISWKFRAMSHRFYNMKDGDDYNATVQDCLKDYKKLLKCRDNIEKIFGPLTLWLLISSAVVLCSNMFQISKVMFMTKCFGYLILMMFLHFLCY
uniref:Olfactory receptor 62 n=1 Tax=Meteorus pulchricornis TaxID=51522 RepID=A0A1S5VFP5_9HYME|nr:olfactory receptor 62 [Meteorus pulchricornis]